jgi:hypothetical protein
MGIPTLISTTTASNAASVDITSGISSTYDEYMFVCTDIGPATDGQNFTVQFNVVDASGFNETITSTYFRAYHSEADDSTNLHYETGRDQAQGTSYQPLTSTVGNGADESCAGILHLFSPSSTTCVTHFYSRFSQSSSDSEAYDEYSAGYVNATAAVDEISFKFASGNMDGVVQMYGIK